MEQILLSGGQFWENWNVFKSLLLVGGIGGVFIFLALLFGGKITKKFKWEAGVFIIVGVIVAAIIGISIWMFTR